MGCVVYRVNRDAALPYLPFGVVDARLRGLGTLLLSESGLFVGWNAAAGDSLHVLLRWDRQRLLACRHWRRRAGPGSATAAAPLGSSLIDVQLFAAVIYRKRRCVHAAFYSSSLRRCRHRNEKLRLTASGSGPAGGCAGAGVAEAAGGG